MNLQYERVLDLMISVKTIIGISHSRLTIIIIIGIFILLSRESDHDIRARLGVAGHLSATLRSGSSVKCLSQRHKK